VYSGIIFDGLHFFFGWPALQGAALVIAVAMLVVSVPFRWLRRR